MTVKAMPIANREEVKALYPIHIGRKNEGVLVLLEGVSRDVAYRGRKGEFSNNLALRFEGCERVVWYCRMTILLTAMEEI